jgi:hypothetical protein
VTLNRNIFCVVVTYLMISSTFSSLARFWRIANKSSDMMAIAGVAGQLVFRPVLHIPLNVD